jgi:cell division protein FtsB
MNVKSEEKKIALRLLNKFERNKNRYADSYKGLEEENKILRGEIKDLKTTLKINKGIIEDFVKNTNLNEKNSSYIDKLKEENKTLNEFVSKLTKEKEGLIKKLAFTEQITNDSLNRTREETNLLKSKIFIFENIISKKESIIEGMRRKIDKIQDSETFKQEVYERELYVIIT